MYRVMILITNIDGSTGCVDTGYCATEIEEAEEMQNELLVKNPHANFVIFREEN